MKEYWIESVYGQFPDEVYVYSEQPLSNLSSSKPETFIHVIEMSAYRELEAKFKSLIAAANKLNWEMGNGCNENNHVIIAARELCALVDKKVK
jgi:hypothetical protein